MNNPKFFGVSLLALLFIPFLTHTTPHNVKNLSIAASIGYLSGKSKEFVYDVPTGQKISELDWEISGSPIMRGEINFHLVQLLDLNAQGWITLNQSNAIMDDYDWLNPNQTSWTHWSHHIDTNLRQGNQFDLNLRSWLIQKPSYQLAAIAGYQRSLFSFRAKGGFFTYNNGEKKGYFPFGKKVLGYKQVFESPYLGLAGKYLVNSFEFNGLFKFSSWVNAKDVDQHYLRHLVFNDEGNQFNYYNVVLNAGYFLKPKVKLFVEGSLSYFPHNSSDTITTDNTTQEHEYSPKGSSGLGNRNYIIALGIQYTAFPN